MTIFMMCSMKRHVLKFDQFLVWIFRMQMGERKKLKPIEIHRGLDTHGPTTLNVIPVFTQGKFEFLPNGYVYEAGMGGFRWIEGESQNCSLVALEDNSEYHCITPRDREARFWNRQVLCVDTGNFFHLSPKEYCYVAAGKLGGDEKLIYNSGSDSKVLIAHTDAITVIMSNDDD